MPEREQLIEIGVAVGIVFAMLGVMIAIGMTYGGDDGILDPDAADLLVGAIVGFILLSTGVGIGLAYALNEPGEGLDEETTTNG